MKSGRYKGMNSADALLKKQAGHVNEDDPATLISGEVNKSGQPNENHAVSHSAGRISKELIV